MHIGKGEIQKPASFVGNTVEMIARILFSSNYIHNRNTYYLADYPGYTSKEWANNIAGTLNAKRIKTAPLWLLNLIAKFGFSLKILKVHMINNVFV